MLLQGTPGEILAADGTPLAGGSRAGRQGDLIVSQLHGRMFEESFRRRIFRTTIAALTVLSTHVSPLAGVTGVPILGISNPVGSGVLLVVKKLVVATTSGTPGGPLLWNHLLNNAVLTAAPVGTYVPSFLGAATGSKAQLFNNTALTAPAGSAAAVLSGVAYPIRAAAAAGGEGPGVSFEEDELVVPPGVLLALAATAAGTTHVVNATIVWGEKPFIA